MHMSIFDGLEQEAKQTELGTLTPLAFREYINF